MDYSSFTTKSLNGLLRELRNDVILKSKYTITGIECTPKTWRGLWDTGASSSCIHKRVQQDMNLHVLGTNTISTANGLVEVDTGMVDVILPNGVTIPNLLVSCAEIGDDVDILLGMDIICCGNFAVSNMQTTYHSFIIPSNGHIDFNQHVSLQNRISMSHKKKKR